MGKRMKPPFEKVVAQHGGTVLRVCRVILGIHDAEDAWSETFLAAMRAYPDLPDNANAEAWLVTIAQRKAIDVLRARKRQPVAGGRGAAGETTPGRGLSLRRGAGVRRDRRDPRRQHRCGAPGRGRRS